MKIKSIKTMEYNEVAYDVSVNSTSHTYELSNGVFVHNCLRLPKQFMGFTDDGAGFNGGQSLSIISSRYAKMIKRIQNSLVQALTDVINIYLIDKGFQSYLGKFTIKMQPPTTQEEIDRRDATSNQMQLINDTMNLLNDVSNPVIKLKILKTLLSNVVSDDGVTNLLEDEINRIESEQDSDGTSGEPSSKSASAEFKEPRESGLDLDMALNLDGETERSDEIGNSAGESPSENLPTPEEISNNEIDFTNNDQEF